MAAAAGLISFAGMFVFAWLTKPSAKSPSTEGLQPTPAAEEPIPEVPLPQLTTSGADMQSTAK